MNPSPRYGPGLYSPGDLLADYDGGRQLRWLDFAAPLPIEIVQDLQTDPFAAATRSLQVLQVEWSRPAVAMLNGFSFTLVSRLNICARAGVGFYVEICQDLPEENVYYPVKAGSPAAMSRRAMSRIWQGSQYYRIPAAWILTLDEVVSVVGYFWSSQGGRWPGLPWQTGATIDWEFYLPPEDDLHNPNEPRQRPASQESRSREALFRELGLSRDDFV